MESGFTGVTMLSFNFANYGSLTAGRLAVEISEDGDNWFSVMDPTAGTYEMTEKIILIDYNNSALVEAGITTESNVRFRFLISGPEGNDSRMNIDEIKIY